MKNSIKKEIISECKNNGITVESGTVTNDIIDVYTEITNKLCIALDLFYKRSNICKC